MNIIRSNTIIIYPETRESIIHQNINDGRLNRLSDVNLEHNATWCNLTLIDNGTNEREQNSNV